MRVVIIGGSGHIGTYLIPMLAELGHEVINVTRGQRQPYVPHASWKHIKQIEADRDVEDQDGTFARRIADLKPDVVVDLICFTESSAAQMVEALRGKIQHFLHCGTIWVFGHSTIVPATEDLPMRPFGDYGIQKAAIETYLLAEARRSGFPATVLRSGHIVGPGYGPLNPAGNFNPDVFSKIARGETLALANLGLETVHHVHAADVAQGFVRMMASRTASIGESFHIVSPSAITLRGYAEAVYGWFGHEPKLEFLPWPEWRSTVSESDANATWDHIAHSPNASIAKAQRLLSYQPRYSSLQAVYEALQWLIAKGTVQVSG
jgi:nucleoside-diphosphate-sugar epimerase